MTNKQRSHSHEYDAHPNANWTRTHVACRVCGFCYPIALLPGAVERGAKDVRAETCAKGLATGANDCARHF